jgi:chromosome segregation ATPase
MEGGLEALNPSWRLEMGDCEFKHVDSMDQIDAEGEVPRGIVKLSSSNKEALSQQFSEIEEQLIQSRLSLAQSESEKFDLRTQIDQTENKFTKLQQEMKTLEQQLVSTKMQFAEVQAENDNLKTEIKKVQQGGGSTSTPKKGLFGRK